MEERRESVRYAVNWEATIDKEPLGLIVLTSTDTCYIRLVAPIKERELTLAIHFGPDLQVDVTGWVLRNGDNEGFVIFAYNWHKSVPEARQFLEQQIIKHIEVPNGTTT